VVSGAAFLNASLQYDPFGVQLTLRRNDVDLRATGTRGNQTAVATALNGLVHTATGEMAGVINNVYDLSNADAVDAMGSMTGVLHQHVALSSIASAQTFIDANMARLGHLAGHAGSGMNPALGTVQVSSTAAAGRQGAWFSGVGGFTRFAGGDGDPAARVSDRGFAVGYDAAIGNHLIVGASAGDTSPDLELESVVDRTSSQMRHVGGYARYARGASRVTALGGGSRVENETARSVSDGLAFGAAHARYDAGTLFSRVEYGHSFPLGGGVTLEPQAGFQYARVNIDGFTEDGAGVLSLVSASRRLSSERSFLGGRAVKTFGRADAADTRVELRAAWAHEFNPVGSARMRFLGDTAGNEFDLTSPARFENSAVVGATFAAKAFRRVRFLTSVDGDFGGAVRLWTASVGLRAEW
jgi:uncharacterized protein with beta-barrel porin domain